MSTNELTEKIRTLRELQALIEEAQAEAEGIKDAIKAHMDSQGVDTLAGSDWKVTWKPVTSSRMDTAALKKALPEIAERFMKSTTNRRFVLA